MLCALTMQALLPGLVAWQLEPASAAVDDVVCDAIYVAALKVGLSGLALGRRTSVPRPASQSHGDRHEVAMI